MSAKVNVNIKVHTFAKKKDCYKLENLAINTFVPSSRVYLAISSHSYLISYDMPLIVGGTCLVELARAALSTQMVSDVISFMTGEQL